jgi:molecular chaperone IbpA
MKVLLLIALEQKANPPHMIISAGLSGLRELRRLALVGRPTPHRFQEDAMRFDLSPLYRSTVGFDSLASMLDQVAGFNNEADTYPPYNIERLTENKYRITMAVAGFGKQDVQIEVKENTLSIRGEKKDADKERTFLHRGIASRAFERRFQLADHVEVRGADVKDGVLSVDLEREIPERLKPRMIEIGAAVAKENKTIDASVAA